MDSNPTSDDEEQQPQQQERQYIRPPLGTVTIGDLFDRIRQTLDRQAEEHEREEQEAEELRRRQQQEAQQQQEQNDSTQRRPGSRFSDRFSALRKAATAAAAASKKSSNKALLYPFPKERTFLFGSQIKQPALAAAAGGGVGVAGCGVGGAALQPSQLNNNHLLLSSSTRVNPFPWPSKPKRPAPMKFDPPTFDFKPSNSSGSSDNNGEEAAEGAAAAGSASASSPSEAMEAEEAPSGEDSRMLKKTITPEAEYAKASSDSNGGSTQEEEMDSKALCSPRLDTLHEGEPSLPQEDMKPAAASSETDSKPPAKSATQHSGMKRKSSTSFDGLTTTSSYTANHQRTQQQQAEPQVEEEESTIAREMYQETCRDMYSISSYPMMGNGLFGQHCSDEVKRELLNFADKVIPDVKRRKIG